MPLLHHTRRAGPPPGEGTPYTYNLLQMLASEALQRRILARSWHRCTGWRARMSPRGVDTLVSSMAARDGRPLAGAGALCRSLDGRCLCSRATASLVPRAARAGESFRRLTSLSPRLRSDRKRVMSARAYCFLTVRTASARMAVSRTSFDPEVWSRRYHFVVLQSCRPRSVLLLYRTSCSLYLPMALPLASYQFFTLKLLLRTRIRTQAAMWVSYRPYQAPVALLLNNNSYD